MTKAEYHDAMARSHSRGYSEHEVNYRIMLRDDYIASLESENAVLNEALQIAVIDRTMGGNRPVREYIEEARAEIAKGEK